ncbi:class II fructose-bisphosphate aldolase [Cohnella sp.]|uniref:class II fructose-bisphosphate aldolase n=1 Tax=Cohnella sp. TaxID=1883426 RepID=UPI003568073A
MTAEDIRRAISCGTAKINVNTDNQMAFSSAVRSFLIQHEEEYDPRNYLKLARDAVKRSVVSKMQLFGSVGKA